MTGHTQLRSYLYRSLPTEHVDIWLSVSIYVKHLSIMGINTIFEVLEYALKIFDILNAITCSNSHMAT